jgi:excisionase family DNA binding protein
MSDFNFSFPIDQLANAIVEKLQNLYIPIPNKSFKIAEEYLTKKQIKALLQISYPTIDTWSEKGILKVYRIGTRKRYKKSEVEAALLLVDYGKIK